MEYVSLGVIKDSFGLDGTMKIYSTTSNQAQRYKAGSKIFLYNPQTSERKELNVIKYRQNGPFDFVKVEELNSPEEIKELKGQEIHAIKDDISLEKGMYFYSDLKGCDVVDKDNNILGTVKEVEEYPAQLTLRVGRKGKSDFFVPFVKQFIKSIDIENKRILIEIIEGLL
ncbi:MAG: 16S rRNA processing protein RimM [Bacilli bacterium]|nr:16S rRNA processing protein RimM [Bacilli bacterium]